MLFRSVVRVEAYAALEIETDADLRWKEKSSEAAARTQYSMKGQQDAMRAFAILYAVADREGDRKLTRMTDAFMPEVGERVAKLSNSYERAASEVKKTRQDLVKADNHMEAMKKRMNFYKEAAARAEQSAKTANEACQAAQESREEAERGRAQAEAEVKQLEKSLSMEIQLKNKILENFNRAAQERETLALTLKRRPQLVSAESQTESVVTAQTESQTEDSGETSVGGNSMAEESELSVQNIPLQPLFLNDGDVEKLFDVSNGVEMAGDLMTRMASYEGIVAEIRSQMTQMKGEFIALKAAVQGGQVKIGRAHV